VLTVEDTDFFISRLDPDLRGSLANGSGYRKGQTRIKSIKRELHLLMVTNVLFRKVTTFSYSLVSFMEVRKEIHCLLKNNRGKKCKKKFDLGIVLGPQKRFYIIFF
jgi:hypothetical protein